MSQQTAEVGSYSEGVRKIIKELETEARSLVPEFIMIEAKYSRRIQNGTEGSTRYICYELRSSNPQKPDPIELIGPTYDLESKKLRFHVHGTYVPDRIPQEEGVQNQGVWFSAKIEKDCDLIPGVVSGIKFPKGFRTYCRNLNGWGVFVTREELEQIQTSV